MWNNNNIWVRKCIQSSYFICRSNENCGKMSLLRLLFNFLLKFTGKTFSTIKSFMLSSWVIHFERILGYYQFLGTIFFIMFRLESKGFSLLYQLFQNSASPKYLIELDFFGNAKTINTEIIIALVMLTARSSAKSKFAVWYCQSFNRLYTSYGKLVTIGVVVTPAGQLM